MNKISAGLLAIVIVFFMSIGIKSGTSLPSHAQLLADTQKNKYATVPCIINNTVDQSYVANVDEVLNGTEEAWYEPFVIVITRKESIERGMKPDRACANADGFIHLEPLLWNWLGWSKRRVADDGTVLW